MTRNSPSPRPLPWAGEQGAVVLQRTSTSGSNVMNRAEIRSGSAIDPVLREELDRDMLAEGRRRSANVRGTKRAVRSSRNKAASRQTLEGRRHAAGAPATNLRIAL
jgi:hypothetical protein